MDQHFCFSNPTRLNAGATVVAGGRSYNTWIALQPPALLALGLFPDPPAVPSGPAGVSWIPLVPSGPSGPGVPWTLEYDVVFIYILH
jgi:hypothetical protein